MQFLPDVYITCEVCEGKQYNKEALEVMFNGKNIADVLDMSVLEAAEFFNFIPSLSNRLLTLNDVGLSYVKLGQPAPTLSGGEAQRVKLASELSKRGAKSLYLLDEPTSGLHFADLEKLLHVLRKLVDIGNSVIVIEHNLDIIKNADYIIDLGPEGGEGGGNIVATGTPQEIANNPKSHTGAFLKKIL
jgi:excinuclease ABC subunit A